MKKKIILGTVALVAMTAGVAGMSAFEAHVINVTAKIENALNVPIEEIKFGTVFPQEALDRFFDVSLSQSFIAEDRVDDVEYVVRQKPKCADDPLNPTAFSRSHEDGQGNFVCDNAAHEILPLLCPYLSKSEVTQDGSETDNDGVGILAFHGPIVNWTLADTLANQVKGRLAKAADDLSDTWKVDLKTPCFGGNCAQDWEEFVLGANSSAIPADYVQPIENEHKIYGCDLWVEVFGISLPGGFTCEEEIDLVLVLDRSLSIDSTELATMKTAALAFVSALAPNGGPHVGQASFAPSATLDLHLTGVKADIDAAIAALSTVGGNSTNLEDGILVASGELDNADAHERPAIPDFMVIITDGAPNDCNGGCGDPAAAAKAAADAAKAAGTTIYVVGVGTSTGTAAFLRDDIASTPGHYFDSADFASLETVLTDLISCPI